LHLWVYRGLLWSTISFKIYKNITLKSDKKIRKKRIKACILKEPRRALQPKGTQ
jgi:hypothetical protein